MDSSKPYERIKLPNAVRLLLVPMSGVDSVATAVMVGVGSRYETPQINGVSHFLEHMVFKGTKKYPTTDDTSIVERLGGIQNAYTDIDITSYHNKVLSTDWELALDVNRELALAPLLEQKHVDRERDVIIEEMKRYEDEPAAKLEETFHSMMYPSSRLGMRTIGEEKSLRAADAKTLRIYRDTWYRPDRIVVVLAGRLKDSVSGIKDKTAAWFGSLKGAASDDIEKVKDHQLKPKFEVVTKPDAQQAHLMIGLRTFARRSEDRFAWNLINLVLGVGFTSWLFKEVREKRGLCYHIKSSSSNWADVGYWSIYAGVATAKVEEATRAIVGQLSKAVEKGISNKEIAIAKKRIKTLLSFRSEDPEFFTEYYGRQEVFSEPLMTLDEYLVKIEAVTKDQIDRLLRKYVTTKTLNMALVWNKARDGKLEKLLKV